MKVVADTMMWVSHATAAGSYRRRLIETALQKRVRFYISHYILDEFANTLMEDFDWPRQRIELARQAILRRALVVSSTSRKALGLSDPADEPIIYTSLNAKADYLVTADKPLLAVGRYQDIQIISPSRFEELLELEPE